MKTARVVTGVVLIIAVLILPGAILGSLNPPKDETMKITGEGHATAHVALVGDDPLSGEFKVKEGNVTFFICDEDNYKKYRDTGPGSYWRIEHHELMENKSAGKYDFTIPEGDTMLEIQKWYMVFDTYWNNQDTTEIDSSIEFTPFTTLVFYLKVIVIIICLVSIATGFIPEKKTVEQIKSEASEPASKTPKPTTKTPPADSKTWEAEPSEDELKKLQDDEPPAPADDAPEGADDGELGDEESAPEPDDPPKDD